MAERNRNAATYGLLVGSIFIHKDVICRSRWQKRLGPDTCGECVSLCACLRKYICVYIPSSPVKSEDQVLKRWESGSGLGFSEASVTF